MTKIGNFRGMPVYRLSSLEWRLKDTRTSNELFVVDDFVYFYDEIIGTLDSRGKLQNFDEDKFDELVKKVKNKMKEEPAEVRPQVEEKSEPETVETGDGIVDEFMSSWRSNIDSEIEKMKKMSEELEKKYREVG
jgi:hypothetical protein